MKELSRIDYDVLKFISLNSPVALSEIKNAFPNFDAIENRLKFLTLNHKNFPAVIKEEFKTEHIGNNVNRKYLGIYSLTDYGNYCLLNDKANNKKQNKEMWLKNVWIPIIVSFLTTILTTHIIPMLPQILKWFVGILSKIF